MRQFILLLTLLVGVARAEAFPDTFYYHVDRNLIREAYDLLICQGGKADIQERLKLDDEQKNVRFELSEDDRAKLQQCVVKLAGGANYDMSKSLRQKLIASLRPHKCRDNEVILSLDQNVAREWTRQLSLAGSTEKSLRVKIVDSLKLALAEPTCGTVWKT